MTYEGFRNIARQYDVVETHEGSDAHGEFYVASFANGYAVRYSDHGGSAVVSDADWGTPLNEGHEMTIEEAFRHAGSLEG